VLLNCCYHKCGGIVVFARQPTCIASCAPGCCSAADTTGRGIVNFGQTLVWYSAYLLATSKQRQASSRQILEQLEAQQWQ
jgi:hypothetical protein